MTQTEVKQDKSMARLARILEQNGVDVNQHSEGNRGYHAALPFILFKGDEEEGHKVAEIVRQNGFTPKYLYRCWDFNPHRPNEKPYWKLVFRILTRRQ